MARAAAERLVWAARPLLGRLGPRPARRLGAALARLAGPPPGAIEEARDAFPELSPAALRKLVRRAWAERGAAIADDAVAERQGPVALCRRLTLVGWDRLHAAEEMGGGLVVVVPSYGAFEIARRVVGLYRPDLEIRGFPEEAGSGTGTPAYPRAPAAAPLGPRASRPLPAGSLPVVALLAPHGDLTVEIEEAIAAASLESRVRNRPEGWPWGRG